MRVRLDRLGIGMAVALVLLSCGSVGRGAAPSAPSANGEQAAWTSPCDSLPAAAALRPAPPLFGAAERLESRGVGAFAAFYHVFPGNVPGLARPVIRSWASLGDISLQILLCTWLT